MKPQPHATASTGPGRELAAIGLIAVVAGLAVALGWVGFLNSDDGLYLSDAEAWLTSFPHLPTAHWGFRHTLVFPLAAAVALGGSSETTMSVVAVAYYAALVALIYVGVRWFSGPRVAFAGALLAATTPLFAVWASIVSIDIPEAVFCLLAIFLFARATIDSAADPAPRRRDLLLVGAGLAAALGLVSRETAAGLALFIGLCFLLGLWMPRTRYLLIGAGAAVVVALESAYYVAMGESPLYRLYTIASTHGTLRLTSADFGAGTGNVTNNRWLSPWVALFVNQEFGLLFYLAVPAGVALWRGRGLAPAEARLARILVGFGIVWFLWISYGGAVRPLPRYYSVMAAAAAIVVAIWLVRMLPRRWAALAAIALVAGNALSLSLENRHPRFGARQYVAYLETFDEPIYTDPRTAGRAWQHMVWRGIEADRARADIPPEGALFLLDPEGLDAWNAERRTQNLPPVEVGASWDVVAAATPPRRVIGAVIGLLGLDGFVPESIRYRLLHGSPPVTLLRVTRQASDASPVRPVRTARGAA